MQSVSAAAIKRLRSKRATHYKDGPTITVLHKHPVTSAALSTSGRLIAETSYEIAMLVRGTPVVISTKHVTRRSDPKSTLAVFDDLVRRTFGDDR